MTDTDMIVREALRQFINFSRIFLDALQLPGAEVRFVCTTTQAEMQIWLAGICIATTSSETE